MGTTDTKRRVQNGYVAKFSSPYCMAVGFLDGKVGFAQFDEERAHAADLIGLAEKISYVIDLDNPYPNRYTGRVSVTLKNGKVIEKSRPNFRGGAHLPLSDEELTQKYRDNCRYGGWDERQTATLEQVVASVAAGGKVEFLRSPELIYSSVLKAKPSDCQLLPWSADDGFDADTFRATR